MSAGRRIAVVGAGTGVGKTHVSCALASELARRGHVVLARKPVESGYVEGASDAAALAKAAGHATVRPRYALAEAVSPHLAARREGVTIDLAELVAWCEGGSLTLVETAGGLLSPLSVQHTNLDLAVALGPEHLVLVVANRLGALHDVRACQLALAAHGLTVTVVLSEPAVADVATAYNADELAALGWAESVVTFPRAALDSRETRAAAATLAVRLGICA